MSEEKESYGGERRLYALKRDHAALEALKSDYGYNILLRELRRRCEEAVSKLGGGLDAEAEREAAREVYTCRAGTRLLDEVLSVASRELEREQEIHAAETASEQEAEGYLTQRAEAAKQTTPAPFGGEGY